MPSKISIERQVLTYLRILILPLGLLMNFGGATFREGLKRVAGNRCFSRQNILNRPVTTAFNESLTRGS
jgi:hypothetical protein